MYPNFNYLSWSYGLAVISMFLHGFAAFFVYLVSSCTQIFVCLYHISAVTESKSLWFLKRLIAILHNSELNQRNFNFSQSSLMRPSEHYLPVSCSVSQAVCKILYQFVVSPMQTAYSHHSHHLEWQVFQYLVTLINHRIIHMRSLVVSDIFLANYF
jgi:hypothetical protein